MHRPAIYNQCMFCIEDSVEVSDAGSPLQLPSTNNSTPFLHKICRGKKGVSLHRNKNNKQTVQHSDDQGEGLSAYYMHSSIYVTHVHLYDVLSHAIKNMS